MFLLLVWLSCVGDDFDLLCCEGIVLILPASMGVSFQKGRLHQSQA